jgi:hypothetical protein
MKVYIGIHKKKSDVFDWFVQNHARLSEEDDCKMKIIRSDNGEMSSLAFKSFCATLGVKQQHTSPGSSFQNGKAERVIRTLRAKAGAALSQSGLPPAFWAEAFTHAAYVHNRLPPSTGGPSPHERVHGSAPSLRLIHPFGCLALARVANRTRQLKLRARVRPAYCLLRQRPRTASRFSIWTPSV